MSKRKLRGPVYRTKGSRYFKAEFRVNGHRYRVSTKKTTKAEAELERARLMREYVEREAPPPRPRGRAYLACPPFQTAAESYVNHQEARGCDARNYNTLIGYTRSDGETISTTGLWAREFTGRRLDSIAPEEIEQRLDRWQTERGWSGATRNKYRNQLAGLFSHAYGRSWINVHPMARGRVATVPTDNERDRWLRFEEIVALARAARTMQREVKQRRGTRIKRFRYLVPIIRLAAFTGLRRGELCRLRLSDLQYDSNDAAFLALRKSGTKNRRVHRVFLEGAVRAVVERQARRCRFPADFLLPGPGGNKSAYTAIGRDLPLVAAEVGIEYGNTRDGFTFHSFRRTMASLAADLGATKEEIKKLGNWRSDAAVNRYIRHSDSRLRERAAALASVGRKRKLGTVGHSPAAEERGQVIELRKSGSFGASGRN